MDEYRERRGKQMAEEMRIEDKHRLAEQKELSTNVPKLSPTEVDETVKRGLEGAETERAKK
jgi:hypothetical protein